jgi:hypothetical protein
MAVTTNKSAVEHSGYSLDNDVYDKFVDTLQANFTRRLSEELEKNPSFQLLTVGPSKLFSLYLKNVTASYRAANTCTACSNFFHHYGGMVAVDPTTGKQSSLVWDIDEAVVPRDLRKAVASVRAHVESSDIVGVVVLESEWLGIDRDEFRHISLRADKRLIWDAANNKLNAYQRGSEMVENVRTLTHNIQAWPADVIREAVRLLNAGRPLDNADKFLARAKWTLEIRERLDHVRGSDAKRNLTWLAGVTAPAGWASITNSALGILLAGIKNKKSISSIAAEWNEVVKGDNYLRPKAAPAAATVAAAEKAFEKLGAAPALRRRFARLDDITERIWEPAAAKAEPKKKDGIFASVRTKDAPRSAETPVRVATNAVSITWEKFTRKHLPEAVSIEAHVPAIGDFCAFVTAVHPDARPILKWDSPEKRNPVSLYRYVKAQTAASFGLIAGQWVPVSAIAKHPMHWGRNSEYKEAILILRGCVDNHSEVGLALFPDDMRGEYHEFRSVIEAYANAHNLEGHDEASACGLPVNDNARVMPVRLRVTDKNGSYTDYTIDRFD